MQLQKIILLPCRHRLVKGETILGEKKKKKEKKKSHSLKAKSAWFARQSYEGRQQETTRVWVSIFRVQGKSALKSADSVALSQGRERWKGGKTKSREGK